MDELIDEFVGRLEPIRADNTKGARELLKLALGAFHDTIKAHAGRVGDIDELMPFFLAMIKVKEEMVPFRNACVAFVEKYRQGSHLDKILPEILHDMELNDAHLAGFFAKHVRDASKIITISRSSSILLGFTSMAEDDQARDLFILESRPNLEGRQFAQEMLELGYTVHLGVDASMSHFFREFDIDLAIIGADAIHPNGDVLNKIGSVSLALASREDGVPFLVVSGTDKVMARELNTRPSLHPPGEVFGGPSHSNLEVHNPYFEIVPRELVTGYITENGYNEQNPAASGKSIPEKYLEMFYR